MTALSRDRKTDQVGVPDEVIPSLLAIPVAAATSIFAGALVAIDMAGNAVPASASAALKCVGRAEADAINTVAAGVGTAGDIKVTVRQGAFLFNVGTGANAITGANRLAYCYASDDNTVNLTDNGGVWPLAGIILGTSVELNSGPTGQIAVMVGMASPYNLSQLLVDDLATAFKARVVMTNLAANTGTTTGTLTITATGALAAQDGVTCVAGDVVFIQEGTTNLGAAADAGPYVISVIGATGVSAVLTRPDWWAHGAGIIPGVTIEIGPDGTGTNPSLAGTTWKTFCAKAKIIDTDAPVFWPRAITCAVTLASGTLAAARTTMPVRSHLVTGFLITSDPATAPHASTRDWRVSAVTAGVTGTASVQIVAESAPGTTNASDVGQYNITTQNW